MQREGLRSHFPMNELSVAGFTEVVSSLPRLLFRLIQTVRAIHMASPDVVIGVDSQGFNLRILRAITSRAGARVWGAGAGAGVGNSHTSLFWDQMSHTHTHPAHICMSPTSDITDIFWC